MPTAVPPALAAVAHELACPTCGAALRAGDGQLACPEGHRHDVARAGYVALLPSAGSRHPGDSAQMVAARVAVLEGGHLEAITRGLVTAARAASSPSRLVADLGAGPGHHLAAVLEALPGAHGVALDTSRPALRRAARAHARMAAVGCDVWSGLPFRDAAVGLGLCVFAPRNPAELARVLAPGGALVVVTPAPEHLQELVPVGLLDVAAHKRDRLRAQLAPAFSLRARRHVTERRAVRRAEVAQIVAMGPAAHHVSPELLAARVAALPETVTVTVAVVVETFARGPGGRVGGGPNHVGVRQEA